MHVYPADRKARPRAEKIEPRAARRRIAAIFTGLTPAQHPAAIDLVASWPRLIHHLAREGELAAPAFDRSA